MSRTRSEVLEASRSLLQPSLWVYVVRLLNFLYQGHSRQVRLADVARDARLSPTSTYRNGERIRIGARSHVGEACSLWAGDRVGRIEIGQDALFGPGVYITASNYGSARGRPIMQQPKQEADVIIGDDVWLGAYVTVLPGVRIGDGCVVGAGAVVTKDLPVDSIAVGVPARVVGTRR